MLSNRDESAVQNPTTKPLPPPLLWHYSRHRRRLGPQPPSPQPCSSMLFLAGTTPLCSSITATLHLLGRRELMDWRGIYGSGMEFGAIPHMRSWNPQSHLLETMTRTMLLLTSRLPGTGEHIVQSSTRASRAAATSGSMSSRGALHIPTKKRSGRGPFTTRVPCNPETSVGLQAALVEPTSAHLHVAEPVHCSARSTTMAMEAEEGRRTRSEARKAPAVEGEAAIGYKRIFFTCAEVESFP